MRWFKSKSPEKIKADEKKRLKLASVEIVATDQAKKQVVEDAKKATEELHALLEQNHFTLQLYVAAGGSLDDDKKSKKSRLS